MASLCKKMTLQRVVEMLVEKHGGLRAAARATGIDPAYLLRLRAGDKTNPSFETLSKLGVRQMCWYEWVK